MPPFTFQFQFQPSGATELLLIQALNNTVCVNALSQQMKELGHSSLSQSTRPTEGVYVLLPVHVGKDNKGRASGEGKHLIRKLAWTNHVWSNIDHHLDDYQWKAKILLATTPGTSKTTRKRTATLKSISLGSSVTCITDLSRCSWGNRSLLRRDGCVATFCHVPCCKQWCCHHICCWESRGQLKNKKCWRSTFLRLRSSSSGSGRDMFCFRPPNPSSRALHHKPRIWFHNSIIPWHSFLQFWKGKFPKSLDMHQCLSLSLTLVVGTKAKRAGEDKKAAAQKIFESWSRWRQRHHCRQALTRLQAGACHLIGCVWDQAWTFDLQHFLGSWGRCCEVKRCDVGEKGYK